VQIPLALTTGHKGTKTQRQTAPPFGHIVNSLPAPD
jgi:hypothetical protein